MQNNVGKYSFKLGDKVQHLDEMIEGEVVVIHEKSVVVSDQDGFEHEIAMDKLIFLPDQSEENHLKTSLLSGPVQSKDEENKPKRSTKREKGLPKVPEFDLHLEKMLDHYPNLHKNNALDYQLNYARMQLERAIANKTPRVIFIHGVGEGILKQQLLKLIRQYDQFDPQPASPRKYGAGATLVYIRQR
ncbi:Smr/MutS family protein [Aureitalea marina]|uniref:Smr domain-containing protein n=1 Tax=Aureitalea marina TaxID=930804 RepID=A0A2S7KNW7_9FLAO|nr:Smr/MutS family protein [Aureitalea marina]PQB04278.1 hypothetical protein BST85_04705 [Aureitalea marina]